MPVLEKLQKDPRVGRFSTRVVGREGLKIQARDRATRDAIVEILGDEEEGLYTHQSKDDRGLRIVVRGLHRTTPTAWLNKAMLEAGFNAEIAPQADRGELGVLALKRLGSHLVSVERLAKTKVPVQCHRCQAFGHTRAYCRRAFVCMRKDWYWKGQMINSNNTWGWTSTNNSSHHSSNNKKLKLHLSGPAPLSTWKA
ncbi:GL15765 [Drosophila persimilis]|uniref:GL15765 n=1 Tax=Drosophila persimilis TaxID=7234 RepID=B4HC88_DROPE|nr:GL15765 [Drosophila persimilis]